MSLFGNASPRALLLPINEWQWIDPRCNLVLPWLTRPFLDVLVTWDIKNWDVFEWGSGYSTIWFASQCNSVVSVDHSSEWIRCVQTEINSLRITNAVLKYRDGKFPYSISDGGEDSELVNSIDEDDKLYDCIVIDGQYHRNTCALHALKHIKPNGIIILDNANQASINVDSTPTFRLLQKYPHFSYLQTGHPDWRTRLLGHPLKLNLKSIRRIHTLM